MYQPVPPYTDPVPPSTNQYRTWTAPGQLKTGNAAWGLQTSAQFTPGLVSYNFVFEFFRLNKKTVPIATT